MTDAELVGLARRGEMGALDALVRRHGPLVRHIARRYATRPEDIEDLAQEALVAACAHLADLADPARFPEWLAAIARNTARSWQRSRGVQPALLSLEETGETAASEEPEERRALRRLIVQALAALPAGQRRLIELHYLLGYDYAETAALIDLPVAAVRGRLHRAREALRKEWRQMTFDTLEGWELAGRDLDALRAAADFASTDETQAPINSICFRDGALLATDRYRLYRYASAAFSHLPPLVVHANLVRTLRARHPRARRARLALAGGQAVLRLESGEEVHAPVLEVDYPNAQRVLDAGCGATRATVRAGDWFAALDSFEQHRAELTDMQHGPRLLLAFSPEEGHITLRAAALSPQAASVAWCLAPDGNALDVTMRVPILDWEIVVPAAFAPAATSLLVGMNADYFASAVKALALAPGEQTVCSTNGPLHPFRLQPQGRDDVCVATMPMQLPVA